MVDSLDSIEITRLQSMLKYEKKAKKQGFSVICGVDEAGRGPLAGPVVAAACILPAPFYRKPLTLRYLNDSKLMTESQRSALFDILTADPHVRFGIGAADHHEIDAINILQATTAAMKRALENLGIAPDVVLLDGRHAALGEMSIWPIVYGDQLSLSIAAASVLAKVTRDRLMRKYHEEYPHYGFDQHKGYGTKKHLEAVNLHGPCPIHRRSFAPIKEYALL